MSCGINACTLPGRMAGGGCGCTAGLSQMANRQVAGRQSGGVCALANRQSGGVCPLALAGYPGRMAGGGRKCRSTCKCLNKLFGAFKGGKTRRIRRQTRRKRAGRK